MIKRKLQDIISSKMGQGKAIILIGARQVGKSTLLQTLIDENDASVLTLNCDEPTVRDTLHSISAADLRLLLGSNKTVMIDEAQRVDDIGLVIKRIIDNYPDIQVLATGSSSLGLRSHINEPLTGSKFEYEMYPVSTGEIYETYGLIHTREILESRLIYGSYPDVLMHPEDAQEILTNLSDSYLYKNILELDTVRKPDILRRLLVALVLQTGSEVSYNELALTLGNDVKTIERYIKLLENVL